jgi:hypothetical protein
VKTINNTNIKNIINMKSLTLYVLGYFDIKIKIKNKIKNKNNKKKYYRNSLNR